MQDKWIAHVDINSCYAAIECLYHPELRHLPVAICGDIELRKGIVIAANSIAKMYGITVGEDTNGSAKRKCPGLIILKPRQALYDKFCLWAREICLKYSDFVENYGPDGFWIDVTHIVRDKYEARRLADEIRIDFKETLGLTVSVGASFNKTISKLAAELKKPDATTVITRETFKAIVWPLPPDKLLGINKKANLQLYTAGITDIGNIAKNPVEIFEDAWGINGWRLHHYASGEECSPVKHKDYVAPVNSIGHTATTYRDMKTVEDMKHVVYALSERVASRIREQHFKCRTIKISIRGTDLKWIERQGTLETPTCLTNNIAEKAMQIFQKKYRFTKPLRSIGITASNLISDNMGIQSSLFFDMEREEKLEKVAQTMDMLRAIYGYDIIRRGNDVEDEKLTYIAPDYNRAGYRVGSAFLKDA